MRYHLLVKCQRWVPEIRRLWQRVEADCKRGAPRAPSARLLFQNARATPAPLEFLKDTRVGRMSGQILLAGGDMEGESGLEEIELRPQEEEEAKDSEESEEEGGPGPPL